jgi:hypothetical protein
MIRNFLQSLVVNVGTEIPIKSMAPVHPCSSQLISASSFHAINTE